MPCEPLFIRLAEASKRLGVKTVVFDDFLWLF
jgi:hypothetical protein